MDIKEKIKKIGLKVATWVIGNTIWSIISLLIPFTLLIPTAKNVFRSVTEKTYTIKLTNIIVIVVFAIIETFLIKLITNGKSKKQKSNGENITNETRCAEIDYDSLDYYFESYHKHLTVYANGNGILINSFTVVINNINSITEFKRRINIEDAKIDTKFPKFSVMKRTKLSERFDKFGFWCKCLNNKDLIKSTREYYWSDDPKEPDTVSQSNPKVLKWIIEMNPSSIEIGKPYDIVYIMSIPDMFPIKEGRFSENLANIKGTHGKFQSRLCIEHLMKNVKYTVSFENGLELYTKPTGTISTDGEKTNLHYQNSNNIIFDKYIFNTTSPKCNSIINIEWSFKDTKNNARKRKNGGQQYVSKNRD